MITICNQREKIIGSLVLREPVGGSSGRPNPTSLLTQFTSSATRSGGSSKSLGFLRKYFIHFSASTR